MRAVTSSFAPTLTVVTTELGGAAGSGGAPLAAALLGVWKPAAGVAGDAGGAAFVAASFSFATTDGYLAAVPIATFTSP